MQGSVELARGFHGVRQLVLGDFDEVFAELNLNIPGIAFSSAKISLINSSNDAFSAGVRPFATHQTAEVAYLFRDGNRS